eukprot:3934257-Rhodomonas_salina.1
MQQAIPEPQCVCVCVCACVGPVLTRSHTCQVCCAQCSTCKGRSEQQIVIDYILNFARRSGSKKAFPFEYRKLWMYLAPHISRDKMPGAIRIFFTALSVDPAELKSIIPSPSTLSGSMVDMYSIGLVHLATVTAAAEHRCIQSDSSMKASVLYRSTVWCLEPLVPGGKPRELLAGWMEEASHAAEHGADAICDQIEQVERVVRELWLGNPEIADKINLTMWNDESMTDHANSESATMDEVERRIYKLLEKIHCEAFTSKTEEEKADMVKMHRSFCFEHKIDNLCKEGSIGLAKFAILSGYVTAEDTEKGKKVSAKSWMYSTHKLLGMPSSKTTQHCKHDDFLTWIGQKLPDASKVKTRAMLKSLGPLVGD